MALSKRVPFYGVLCALWMVLPILSADPASAQQRKALPDFIIAQYGQPPAIPSGAMPATLQAAIQTAFVESMTESVWGDAQAAALTEIATSQDPRVAWIVSDMMRFVSGRELSAALARVASDLLEKDLQTRNSWGDVTDHLIAWDIPAPPQYLETKRAIFTAVLPAWRPLFAEGDIDWRLVSWGGVAIDKRAYDTTDEACNCIPAADNPEVTDAAGGAWLDDDDIVFGVQVNGEYRAYPRQIMEVREMVNDTLGGRSLGIPYCTLCGAAQAYFTDQLPLGVQRPILRTSGLLIRSNKVMFDLTTNSVFDTFLGHAVTGPLAEINLQLEQASVITTDWGTWKTAHPETTVLAERLALGRKPDFRNNRDANGPIFPVGDVDPRLPVHEDILGIVTASGKPVAFQRSKVMALLHRGQEVTFENVHLKLEAGGVKAVDRDGTDLGSHQAFWFAWSQFHPQTTLWPE